MVDEHACNIRFLLYGYAHGSKKFDDMAKNFLEEVAGAWWRALTARSH